MKIRKHKNSYKFIDHPNKNVIKKFRMNKNHTFGKTYSIKIMTKSKQKYHSSPHIDTTRQEFIHPTIHPIKVIYFTYLMIPYPHSKINNYLNSIRNATLINHRNENPTEPQNLPFNQQLQYPIAEDMGSEQNHKPQAQVN